MSLATSLVRSRLVPVARPSTFGLLAVIALLVTAHAYALSLGWDQSNPFALADHLFTVALLGGMLWLSGAIGLRVVRTVGVSRELDLESLILALALGLGALAYAVLALGLLGWLKTWALALLMTSLGIAFRTELAELSAALPSSLEAWRRQRQELGRNRGLRLSIPLAEVLVVLLAVKALAPPTGYDALLYHLAGPQEFLRLGRLAPMPELPQANMPFTVEMLYAVGLAFGSDELPNLLHLSFAVLTALATFSLGRRLFGSRVGWMATAILLSAPALGFYAPLANIDLGWAFFDFVAVYAFVIWTRVQHPRWLVVAGLAAGFSLGSKYLGVLSCGCIALGIGLEHLWMRRGRRAELIRSLACFGMAAALTAAPWYLKNWAWLGSPFWPFLAPDVPDVKGYYQHQMNRETGLLDYLLLPLRLYQGDLVEAPIAVPAALFLVAPCYVLVRKQRLLTYLFALCAVHLAAWSHGIQTVRYLFAIFPSLALLAAYVLDRSTPRHRFRGVAQAAVSALVVLTLLGGVIVAALSVGLDRPLAQLVGLESRQSYLSRALPSFAGVRYLEEHRAEVERVLVVGDAPRFYLTTPARVDQGLEVFSTLATADGPLAAAAELRRLGVSHLLVSPGQISWLSRFDPEQRVLSWWFAFERSRSGYLTTEYSGEKTAVYRLTETIVERH